MNVTRRQFLKIFAATGAAAVAPLSALEQVARRDTDGWPQPERFEGKSEYYFDLINRELEPGDYIVSYRVQPVLSSGIRRVHEVTVADGGEFRIRIYVEPGYKIGELQVKKKGPLGLVENKAPPEYGSLGIAQHTGAVYLLTEGWSIYMTPEAPVWIEDGYFVAAR